MLARAKKNFCTSTVSAAEPMYCMNDARNALDSTVFQSLLDRKKSCTIVGIVGSSETGEPSEVSPPFICKILQKLSLLRLIEKLDKLTSGRKA